MVAGSGPPQIFYRKVGSRQLLAEALGEFAGD